MSNNTATMRSIGLEGTSNRNRNASTLLATLLACIILLTLLGHKPLTNWDEGIYAEISREMLSSNPLIPHWNYQPWFEKPPLMPWITAIFFRLFGISDFWARAGSALSGVAIVALLHTWLISRKSILAAWFSTIILLSIFGFLHVCRVGEMDVLLSLGCCISLCGLTAVEDRNFKGWYFFWAGLAIALMTKGAACIVIVITVLILAAIERWNASLLGKPFRIGLSYFLLAVLPWHFYMAHRFGNSFLTEYFGFHVVARATHQIEEHITHWWYYLWVLLVSAAPFVLLFPSAIVSSFRRKELRAWSVFALVVVIFFTIIQTRLPHYIAPAYPAFAVMTSAYLANRLHAFLERHPQSPASFWTKVVLVITAICIAAAFLTSAPRRKLHQAKVGPQIVDAEKESVQLLREVFSQPQPTPGPLLVWWEGNQRSIATSVFYSRRAVQLVQVGPHSGQTPIDKYLFDPQPLDQAIVSGPRIILLDRYLVQQIPAEYSYHPILVGNSVEVGLIERR